jgi:hypothetical protein
MASLDVQTFRILAAPWRARRNLSAAAASSPCPACLESNYSSAVAPYRPGAIKQPAPGARETSRAQRPQFRLRGRDAEARPDTVALAKELHGKGLSYRKIAAELAAQGHVTGRGKAHVASAVQKMIGR